MGRATSPRPFRSPLATQMRDFLDDTRARGYRYDREEYHLYQLDRFLVAAGHDEVSLPRDLVERWLSSTIHRRPSTHRHRQFVVRQLARFLQARGCQAYCCPLGVKGVKAYVATRVFARDEIRALLTAADHLAFDRRSPTRHIIVPALFRVLYGCGLRAGEALRLTVGDVDLESGVLKIREGKFRRDRLVPLAPGLQRKLTDYAQAMGPRAAEDPFFPSPRGGHYGHQAIYHTFRQLLQAAGILHGGRGYGPRLHEFRHAFAVHQLENWYHAGEDLDAKLPLLATYLGHRSMLGTQWYLQLTRTLFADLTARLDDVFGYVLPGAVDR